MNNILPRLISDLETYGNTHNLNHRFVGSVSYGGLLNKKTTYTINIEKRIIKLKDHNKLSLMRSDNTVRDIDFILFCEDKQKINMLKNYIDHLKKKYSFPLISVEATIYPSFGKRNKLLQFVYALEVDSKNQLFLTFDSIKQPISWNSVEAWSILLENGVKFTSRNPIADYYAYQFRSPSGIRPKDEKKVILLGQLANDIIGKGKKNSIDYMSKNYYANWQQFAKKMAITNSPSITIKRQIAKYYWQTIGTYMAHGKGTGKLFLSMQNQFTGIRQ